MACLGSRPPAEAITALPGGPMVVQQRGQRSCTAAGSPEAQGARLNPLNEHNSGVRSLAFNAQGTLLASVDDDKTVVLWNIEPILTLAPLAYSCAWIADYLRTNAQVPQGDRQLATGFIAAKSKNPKSKRRPIAEPSASFQRGFPRAEKPENSGN